MNTPKKKGPPFLPDNKRKSVVIRACVTKAQAAKWVKLGGAEWLRLMLNTAER